MAVVNRQYRSQQDRAREGSVMAGNDNKNDDEDIPPGYRVVYAKYIRKANGTIVYPKNASVFRFIVKD